MSLPPTTHPPPFQITRASHVVVTVNDRVSDKAHIWVQKDDKTLGFSPY